MGDRPAGCRFCGAASPLVEMPVLDEKWSRRFGGDPVISLDHGWYRGTSGRQVVAAQPGKGKYFRPFVRAACDFCAHGWLEDLLWRAEPAVLALAERRALPPPPAADPGSLVRWLVVTAVLAESIAGLPSASAQEHRHALRAGAPLPPDVRCWVSSLRQRFPARVRMSQVALERDQRSLVQIVSVEIAHFCGLVVMGSDDAAAGLIARSHLDVEMGRPSAQEGGAVLEPRDVDLGRTPHPHRVVVERLCSGSSVPHTER